MTDMEPQASDPDPGQEPWPLWLRTTLVVIGVLGVFALLAAWLGPVIVFLGLANGAGLFAGLVLCPWVGLENPLSDLKWDIAKCLALGPCTVIVIWGLLVLTQLPHVLVLIAVGVGYTIKVLWQDVTILEILLVQVASIIATSIAASLLLPWV